MLSHLILGIKAPNQGAFIVAKPVRHQILTLEITGSNPVIPAKNLKKGTKTRLLRRLFRAPALSFRRKEPKSMAIYDSQVGKAPDSDSGEHRFESYYPSQNLMETRIRFFEAFRCFRT